MTSKALQQKGDDLQRRVTELESKFAVKPKEGWMRIAGAAENDRHFPEAMRLGAEWRKKANKEKW